VRNFITMSKSDQPISAFAFNLAEEIEKVITERTNNLEHQNQILEAKILQFYQKMPIGHSKVLYAIHFGIKS